VQIAKLLAVPVCPHPRIADTACLNRPAGRAFFTDWVALQFQSLNQKEIGAVGAAPLTLPRATRVSNCVETPTRPGSSSRRDGGKRTGRSIRRRRGATSQGRCKQSFSTA
jgi:hypothetical protein